MFCVSNAQDSKEKDFEEWDSGDGDDDDDEVNKEEDDVEGDEYGREREIMWEESNKKRWDREEKRKLRMYKRIYMRMVTNFHHDN